MEIENTDPGYHLWGIDHAAYGPVELPGLVDWIKEGRILADSWIFVERDAHWTKAAQVPELIMFFSRKDSAPVDGSGVTAANAEMKPGALRRIKVFSEMSDQQLEPLLPFLEVIIAAPFTHVMERGEPSDALYGVLEGELRSFIMVDGIECPLNTLPPGSIFGEISLFDRGPRTASVAANEESLLIRLSLNSISRICKEAPETALAFYDGLLKTIAGRVRTLTKRYENSVQAGCASERS